MEQDGKRKDMLFMFMHMHNALGWNQEKFQDKPALSIDSKTGKSINVD